MQTISLGSAPGLYARFHPTGRHPARTVTRTGKVFDHADGTTPTVWDWGAAWVSHYEPTTTTTDQPQESP
jgi:hypothetical protein